MSIPFILVQELRDDCEEQLKKVAAERDEARAVARRASRWLRNPPIGWAGREALIAELDRVLGEGERCQQQTHSHWA